MQVMNSFPLNALKKSPWFSRNDQMKMNYLSLKRMATHAPSVYSRIQFQVLTAVKIQVEVFWSVTPCSVVG
jgi:hypothetical protein